METIDIGSILIGVYRGTDGYRDPCVIKKFYGRKDEANVSYNYSIRNDIFSLGLIYIEMITDIFHPLSLVYDQQIESKIKNDTFTEKDMLNKIKNNKKYKIIASNKTLYKFIKKMLRFDENKRFQRPFDALLHEYFDDIFSDSNYNTIFKNNYSDKLYEFYQLVCFKKKHPTYIILLYINFIVCIV